MTEREGSCNRFPRLWRGGTQEKCFLSSFQGGTPPISMTDDQRGVWEKGRQGRKSNLGGALPGSLSCPDSLLFPYCPRITFLCNPSRRLCSWLCACMQSRFSLVQLCATLWAIGSPVHVILQARTLEQVAVPSSRGSSQPRDQTCVSLSLLHWQAGSLSLASPTKLIIFNKPP